MPVTSDAHMGPEERQDDRDDPSETPRDVGDDDAEKARVANGEAAAGNEEASEEDEEFFKILLARAVAGKETFQNCVLGQVPLPPSVVSTVAAVLFTTASNVALSLVQTTVEGLPVARLFAAPLADSNF